MQRRVRLADAPTNPEIAAAFADLRDSLDVELGFPDDVRADAERVDPLAAPARTRPDLDPIRHDRPARVDGPRPGAPPRAGRHGLPRALRDRRRRCVRRARRPDGSRGARARPDALRAGRECTALSARALRRRWQPAPGRDAPGGPVDDGPRRDGRGNRGRRAPRARPQPREARLRGRAALARRRHARASRCSCSARSGCCARSGRRARAAFSWRSRSRRSRRRRTATSSGFGRCCPSRAGTLRSR